MVVRTETEGMSLWWTLLSIRGITPSKIFANRTKLSKSDATYTFRTEA